MLEAERKKCAKAIQDMPVGSHEGCDDLLEEVIHNECALKILSL